MAPTAAQFSPAQILEAGRRAENDGRVGYAIQFYRHLTDHHNWSPEAAIAKEALTRLANFRPVGDSPTGGGPAPHTSAPQQQAWAAPGNGNGSPGIVNGNGHPGTLSTTAPAIYPQAHARPAANGYAVTAVAAPAAQGLLRLPAPARRYRIGSAVAWLLFGIGLAMMVTGIAVAALQLAGVKFPGILGNVLGFAGGLPGALAIFTVGVMQVFAAQIGRAVFDGANAARDLALIERSKIAHAAGERPFSDEEPD
jgi:hypothetical protein